MNTPTGHDDHNKISAVGLVPKDHGSCPGAARSVATTGDNRVAPQRGPQGDFRKPLKGCHGV